MNGFETRVKICGIMRSEDVRLAAELRAWAIGFIFYRKSSRAVDPTIAASLRRGLPSDVKAVGVFVDSSIEEICNCVEVSGIDMIQLHGQESPEYCVRLRESLPGRAIIKAIRVSAESDVARAELYTAADAYLFDTFVPGSPGGTGQAFDWNCLRALNTSKPVIVAGGLHTKNVKDAIAAFNVFAVDVSSGVELRPGVKDEIAMRAFFAAVREGA